MLGALGVLMALVAPGPAQNVVSVPPGGDVRVTVYEEQGGLFSDRRTVALAAGANELRFEGIPTGAVAGSFDLHVLNGPGVRVLERLELPGIEKPSAGLEALIGQQITLVRRAADGQVAERLSGTLLSVTEKGAVAALQVDDRVILDPRGDIEIEVSTEQLGSLTRKPAAVCRVEAEATGEAELLLSYMVGNAHWDAEHTVALNGDATAMDLASWARVLIPDAAELTLSGLRLVAGSFAEATGTSVFDIGRAVSFGEQGEVRLALATANSIPLTNLLLFDGGMLEEIAGSKPVTGAVARVMRFENSEAANLGTPIPPGEVVVYQVSEGATSKLVSRGAMPASKAGDTVDLSLGQVGGLTGASKQESWRELSPEDIERQCTMVLVNATKIAQTVTCGVTMSGKWRIAESSHEYVTRPSSRVEFTVPMPADKPIVTLKYTVRIEVPTDRAKPTGEEGEAPPVPAEEGEG